MVRIAFVSLALLVACGEAPARDVGPPVLAQIEGGQLICDPFDRAIGFQPIGGKVWALNGAARARARQHPDSWTDIPVEARANIPTPAIEDLRTRAASLCD